MKVKQIAPMEFQLKVLNPFILCFHHRDAFPKGTPNMQPINYLPHHNSNEDFNLEAPWRMYYGDKIPGFPVHPHRGFETITVVTEGYADHFDSFGSKGRYGQGDVQWMTAGSGIQHSEMFPLLSQEQENPMELFQIWLNLPQNNKMVEPSYKMLWAEEIPQVTLLTQNAKTTVKILAGEFDGVHALDATPYSWASDPQNRVSILLIELEPKAVVVLPKVSSTLTRMLYHYSRNRAHITVDTELLAEGQYAQLDGNQDITITNSSLYTSQLLLLAGEPINEPMVAHGPFVMNSRAEIIQAFEDFQATQFGGWPWSDNDPVNPLNTPRFAHYGKDNKTEYPPSKK